MWNLGRFLNGGAVLHYGSAFASKVKGFFSGGAANAEGLTKAEKLAQAKLYGDMPKEFVEAMGPAAAANFTKNAILGAKEASKPSLTSRFLKWGGGLLGIGAVADVGINGRDSVIGGIFENASDGAKKIDAVTDMNGMFTRIGQFFQNLMKLFANFDKVFSKDADIGAIFSDKNDKNPKGNGASGKGSEPTNPKPQGVFETALDTAKHVSSDMAIYGTGTVLTGLAAQQVVNSFKPTPPAGGSGGGGSTPGGNGSSGGPATHQAAPDAPKVETPKADAHKSAATASKAPAPEIHAAGGGTKLTKIMNIATGTVAGAIVLGAGISAARADEPAASKKPEADEGTLSKVGHKAHVIGHGLQNGIVGLAGAPESLYNLFDKWTGGRLPGDHTKNVTEIGAKNLADKHLLGAPELKDAWDRGLHTGAEMSTYFIPVGAALKVAGAGAKIASGTVNLERTRNLTETLDMGQTVAKAGMNLIMH